MARHDVVIVGGGNAGISLAARLRRLGCRDVAVVAPDPVHRYRPLLNYVAGGQASMSRLTRPMGSVIPDGCTLLPHRAVAVHPDEREVELDTGERVGGNDLVIDKWFAVQASVPGEGTLHVVEALQQHPSFTLANPNRLRALAGSFAGTPSAFHRADGRGYDWLAEVIVAADKLNPQTAARFVAPLGRWRKIEPVRAAKMRGALQRILAEPGLSKDVFELASKSLG